MQQQESFLLCHSNTSLDGNLEFVESTCSTTPPIHLQQQEHGIKSEIMPGRGTLSPFAGHFHPYSACVDSSLSSISTLNEYAQMQASPETVEEAMDARILSREEETRTDIHRGTRPGSGMVPLTPPAECWAPGWGDSRQGQPLTMLQNSNRAKGGCNIVGSTMGGEKLPGSGSRNHTGGGRGGGRAGCGNRAGGGGVSGGTGSGRQIAGSRDSSSQLSSSRDCGFGNTTAAQGGNTVTELGLCSATRIGRGLGSGGSTLPSVPPQEAGPGWQQPAPGPAPKKFRRYGSKRKPSAAAKVSAATATKATPP